MRMLPIYKLSIRSAAPLLYVSFLALAIPSFAGTANWAKVSNDHFEGFKMGDSQAAAAT